MTLRNLEDGMTQSEIKLYVAEKSAEGLNVFREGMDEHKREVKKDLSELRTELSEQIGQVLSVVSELTVVTATMSSKLNDIDQKRDDWQASQLREQDRLRDEVKVARDKLEVNNEILRQVDLEVKSVRKHTEEHKAAIQRLGWVFAALKFMKSGPAIDKVFKTFVAVTTGFSAIWLFLHSLIPTFHYYVIERHPFHWFM